MREKILAIRKKSSNRERGYFFLSLIFLLTLWSAGIRFFVYWWVFPQWYRFGVIVLICPFMFNFLDQESLFYEWERKFVNPLLKWVLWISLLLILSSYGLALQNIAMWALLILGLFFWLNGRFSFWLALWMLGFTVFFLVYRQQDYAEITAIYLYYFLCIWVFLELIGGKISHRLGSDFLSHFWNKNLKNDNGEIVWKLEKWGGSIVFVVLLSLSLMRGIHNTEIENLMERQTVIFSSLTVLLMVLRGREYLGDIVKFSKWVGIVSVIVFVGMVRVCLYFPELDLGLLPLVIWWMSVGMVLVNYVFGGNDFLLFKSFISTGDKNEK